MIMNQVVTVGGWKGAFFTRSKQFDARGTTRITVT